ncbi:hypothetical protein FB548_1968 [Pseudoxanthomonas sp. 3HH-4]|uniref:hypothetical protein n=1 Tax=Pseudoxanthomonas sp. 3HH-4 TaxID=1690214 RepID=UPI00114D5AC9|nr:hypothetical protein [Pseudoxanthomonas sp. 3HH-4]TQM13114.1 hypothetical protein FB548_1968 [Pseudoxanthomonas sp. 3HH-4]
MADQRSGGMDMVEPNGPHYRWAWLTLAGVQALLLAGIGVALAAWWWPEPHSDWAYYWQSAGRPEAYVRGGLGLWLLALPKAFGLSPVAASLVINIPSALWLLFLGYRLDGGQWKILAQLVALYLLLITPFAGIVQLDLVAAAALGTAFWLLADAGLRLASGWRSGLAVACIMFAVSTKPQYALVLWALLVLTIPVAWLLRRSLSPGFQRVLLVLLAGSVLGFAMDMVMRVSSGKTEQIRTSSAVTLYGGLLVSSDQRSQGCGYWSVEAARAAKEDLHKSLSKAVMDRLQAQPIEHWLSVVRCKAPEILSPPPYALYWLIESPNIRARIDDRPDREQINARYYRALGAERKVYGWARGLIILACLWTALLLLRKRDPLGALPVLWLVGFWSVHVVFEVQGRYFLGLFVLAPLLCAAVTRLAVVPAATNGRVGAAS